MVSIREMMACLRFSVRAPGLKWPGEISLLLDFYGYTKHPGLTSLSFLKQVRRIQGKHIHLNLIRVGLFTANQEQQINGAVRKARDIYAGVNVGIGRIEHYYIPAASAHGYEIIDSCIEAHDLTNEWTVHNDALDVFLVRNGWTSTYYDYETGEPLATIDIGGLSKVDGPCNKDVPWHMTGSVISLDGSPNLAMASDRTGRVLAHEVGHYLGLEHKEDPDDKEKYKDNVMHGDSSGSNLTSEQGAEMKDHCFVKTGC